MSSTSCESGQINYFYKTVVNDMEQGGTGWGGELCRCPGWVLEPAKGKASSRGLTKTSRQPFCGGRAGQEQPAVRHLYLCCVFGVVLSLVTNEVGNAGLLSHADIPSLRIPSSSFNIKVLGEEK